MASKWLVSGNVVSVEKTHGNKKDFSLESVKEYFKI